MFQDKELQAIDRVFKAVDGLSKAEKIRVLGYCHDRANDEKADKFLTNELPTLMRKKDT
jgi:hypothetical protein